MVAVIIIRVAALKINVALEIFALFVRAATALTITPFAGGVRPVSAHLVIIQIQKFLMIPLL